MSLSNPQNKDPYNSGAVKPTRFGDATVPYTPTASPLSQIRGISAKGSTGAGIPKHVTNVAASIARASTGTTSAVSVTFSRDPSDTSHSKVNVYVKGYQGNQSPVQIASGSESPVTCVINNTGETVSLLVQSQGNSGEAPLATAPSAGIQLPKSTAGGFGTNTITSTPPPEPITVEYFTGPGLNTPASMMECNDGKGLGRGVADAVPCVRFTLKQNITVSRITWNVAAGNAIGSFVAFGIYSAAGTKIIDSGPMSAASLGVITANISPAITLTAGTVYWFAQTSSSIAVTGPCFDENVTSSALLKMVSNSYTRYGVAANASVSGVLPASLGAITPALTTVNIAGIALALFEA